MQIQRLQLHSFRRFSEVTLSPGPGFNVLTGDNGSGKTSVLEALHLLAHARSFRGRVRDGLVRIGDAALQIFTEWEQTGMPLRRAGLRHSGSQWQARLDGNDVRQLGQLCQALAVVSFDPGSHALVDGSSEGRRRYLDWGLFHVEHSFMPHWQRYARALKQRNALLRQSHAAAQLEAWEQELVHAGECITALREAHVVALQPHLQRMVCALLPDAGQVQLQLQAGWKQRDISLADALLLSRERDQQLGYTTAGPHRADLKWQLRDLPGREGLSRGQTKQLALCLLLAQAAKLAEVLGYWPVVQLDDLGSELDRRHQACVLQFLAGTQAQVMLTGTELPVAFLGDAYAMTRFHVEHGEIRQLK